MEFSPSPHILATDLDGTLIPLPNAPDNLDALAVLRQAVSAQQLHITFVTGRHLESVVQAISEYELPRPDWIICDVGTTICQYQEGKYQPLASYQEHLQQRIEEWNTERLRAELHTLTFLRLQEPQHQSPFKLSFYVQQDLLNEAYQQANQILQNQQIPWSIVGSVDPFEDRAMVDFLPADVNKAYALQWWADQLGHPEHRLIFSGDSGNDLAALEHGYQAIVVGNADRQIARRAFETHGQKGTSDRLYLAKAPATSGVLEGLRWFEALPALAAETPLGVTPIQRHHSRVRVWAPRVQVLECQFRDPDQTQWRSEALQRDSVTGIHSGQIPVGPGGEYQFLLDGQKTRPDPRSQWQPESVHQHSRILSTQYPWTATRWNPPAKKDLVIYELHIGTFTEEGTYLAAQQHLLPLIDLGITAVELLPLAQCPGRWNWGYDGVFPFAANQHYGSPDDLRSFVDTCHQLGLSVILDVVYNHLGPEGNYLADFGPYFTKRHGTPWGDALNFDGPDSDQVRQLMVDNAIHWLDHYRMDGLRLDAIHFMFDDSPYPITRQICDAVRDYEQKTQRQIHLIGEANIFDESLIDARQTNSYCAIWADCLMHSVYSHGVPGTSLAHRSYSGAPDIGEALHHGYLYRGPKLQRESRGPTTPRATSSQQVSSLIMALQTHDSVGNHPHGKRIHQLTNQDFQAAAAALFLLYPAIPMIFMGEEIATDSPFRFFADFLDPGLRKAVDRGRRNEYPNHQWDGALVPSDPQSFYSSKVQRPGSAFMFRWYQQLLQIRKQGREEGWLDADRMTVSLDASCHQFQLTYQCQLGNVSILSQLLPPQQTSEQPLAVPENDDAQILADSWDTLPQRSGGSRCLVYRETCKR